MSVFLKFTKITEETRAEKHYTVPHEKKYTLFPNFHFMAFEVIKQTEEHIQKYQKEKEIKKEQISNPTLCHNTLTILLTFFLFTVNNSTRILC